SEAIVLDPFCGTGTTDINPFLVWLTGAKTAPYQGTEVEAFVSSAAAVAEAIRATNGRRAWVPPLHQIEKWWDEKTLAALSHAMATISKLGSSLPTPALD